MLQFARCGRLCITFLAWSIGLSLFAGDTEQREFSILVDGKDAGSSQMTIVTQDDGTSYMKAKVSVKFQQVVFSYTFVHDTEEWWKDGKLIGMKSVTVENGKKSEVVVGADPKGVRVRAGGKDQIVASELWTSSYWKLDGRHNKQVSILENDSGKELTGTLQFVANEQLTLAGQPMKTFHFRVVGIPSPIDLWYDSYHRLVRQEFTENGHKTIVVLIGAKR